MRRFTKEDIITTDKYLQAFPNNYYKTDVIVNGTMFYWRDKTIYPPTKHSEIIISGHSDYPITDYQHTYFIANDFQDLKNKVISYSENMTKKFYCRYNSLTNTVFIDRAIRRND